MVIMSESIKRHIERSQRLYDALKAISEYQSPDELRQSAIDMGLEPSEALEMAHENVIETARIAIRKIKRPEVKG